MSQPTDHHGHTMESSDGRLVPRSTFHRFPVMGVLWDYTPKEVRAEARALGKVAGPIVITTFLLLLRSLISMMFLGGLSKRELAAGSLALGVWNVTGSSVIKGLAMWMDPICSQAFGAKNLSLLARAFYETLALLFLASIPITVVCLNTGSFLLSPGHDLEVTRLVGVFMAFYIPESFAQSLLQPLRALLRTQGLTVPVTLASSVALILHAPVNYFLVIYMGLGVRGVALGLALHTVNLDLGLLIYIYTSKAPVKPWERSRGVDFRSIFSGLRQLVAPAVRSCLSICLEWWWYSVMLFLCSRVGDSSDSGSSVAAMGVMIQISGLLYSIPFSLNLAVLTLVGNALGAGRPSQARLISSIGFVASVAFSFSALAVTTAARLALARSFTDDAAVADLVASTLPIVGLCMLGNAPRTVASGALFGTARPGLVARANFCSFYLIGMPVTLLLTCKLELGFRGLWLGLFVSEVSGTFMISQALSRTDWKYQAKRAEELTLNPSGKSD